MFDMRYHIVSLVAVFLALAIGIMLGSSIENKGLLKQQQERLVKSIEEDIASIKDKNAELQKQLGLQSKFEEQAAPALIKDKLKDKKIALVYFNDANSNDLKTSASDALKEGGANVEEIALNRSSIKDTEELATELTSTPGPVLASLGQANTWKAPEGFLPLDAVVIFSGRIKGPKEEIALAQSLKTKNAKVVFIDNTDNKSSAIELFVKEGIDTIDNIDTTYGRISLVYLLYGSDSGHFGIGASAKELIPALEQ